MNNVIIEMERGWLFVTGIRDGSLLMTTKEADIGMIGYEIALFSDQAGDVLTPGVRDELKADLLGGR